MHPEELETLLEKLRYLTQGAELVVFAGSLPRDVADDFYAEVARELTRRHVPIVLDTEGEPLRLGIEAEPFSSRRTRPRPKALVGQEFHDDEDFRLALDHIAEMGARNVLITTETGCVSLVREERETRRFARSRRAWKRCRRSGSGDALLGAYLAARHAGRTHEESLRARSRRALLRRSSSAPAASTRAGRTPPGRRRHLGVEPGRGLNSPWACIRRHR